jgi:phage-related protein
MENKSRQHFLNKFECHSGTSKEEILAFIDKHLGSKVILHYEENLYDRWGDDYDIEFELNSDQINKIKQFISKHYIHNIYVI